MRARIILFILLITCLSLTQHTHTKAEEFEGLVLKGTLFDTIGSTYDIDPLLLYSIAITESATGVGKGNIQPHPYVIRTDNGPQFFKNRAAAEKELAKVLYRTTNVDIGMMQINLFYHPQSNPLDLLDPHYNLTYAAQYLKKTLASTDDPILGVGRYHSWTENRANWYGRRVWKTYNNLVQLILFE